MNYWLFELSILLGCLFGYLFGSVLFAQIISKLFLKKNIRQYGSFNPGSTNLTRISNRYFGMMASILDGSKGILTIVFTWGIVAAFNKGYDYKSNPLTSFIFITGIFAVIGHCFPILFIVSLIKTRSYEIAKEHMGGKGVSTAGGILFAFNPWIGLFGFIIWFICLFIYKYVSLSSIVCMVFVPILILLFNIDYANDPLCYTYLINKNILTWTNYPIYVITIIYAINSLLVIVRHQTNIARLINHTENKIGKKIK